MSGDQLNLFDALDQAAASARVARDAAPYQAQRDEAAEQVRFGGQKRLIYERLREGPATNAELAQTALKYSGRISELRLVHGLDIRVIAEDRTTGLVTYGLYENGQLVTGEAGS